MHDIPIKSGMFMDPPGSHGAKLAEIEGKHSRSTAEIVRFNDQICYVQFGPDGLPVDQSSETGREIMLFLENGGEITDAPQK